MKGDYLPPGSPSDDSAGDDRYRHPYGPHPGRAGHPVIELLPPPGREPRRPPHRPHWFRAGLLFALTFVTTITLGAVWILWAHPTSTVDAFPWLSPHTLRTVWTDPANLVLGLSFALPALFILLCHELGHYLACRYYGLPATLPHFLPVPFGIGTLGAFIRIKAPIRSRKQLFDVGVAGPLAGFVALVPFLLFGVALSEPVPVTRVSVAAAEMAGEAAYQAGVPADVGLLLVPGRCLALELTSRAVHGPLPADVVLHLHPFALAAWFGLLVTAMNLLPLGQLDGGHVLYASAGQLQRRLALPLWSLLLLAAFLYWPGWVLWSVIVLFMGLKHPPVADEGRPLGRTRQALAWVALLIFLASFMPVPLEEIYIALP